jgi:hypothetical protein
MCFGNVNVFGASLLRGCGYCKYSEEIPLPPIRKKILYLDQFFFSHAFRGAEPRFVKATERIRSLARQQLLTAPSSSLHEDETLLWSRRDELREFIKDVGSGAKFEPAYSVERTQIVRAFQAWLSGASAEYSREEQDAMHGTLHKWDGYFYVSITPFARDPALIRELKGKSIDSLIASFPSWRADTTTFEEDFERECTAAARGYVDAYATYAQRIGAGDTSALFDSPILSMVMEAMMHCMPTSEPFEERLRKCGAFFKSEHFRQVPSERLSAQMYAAVKAMVKQGAHANPGKAKKKLSGFFYDVRHISTYAPYCDAIVVDRAMAELVAHPQIALAETFGVKVFSLQNWPRLFEWLDSMEASASAEHQAALAAIQERAQ